MTEQRTYWNQLAQYGRYASVIDPNDPHGHKNAYIIGIRDRFLLERIPPEQESQVVLDFGCGTGNISHTLSAHGQRVVGTDISDNLLKFAAQQHQAGPCVFLRYDGKSLPLQDDAFDFAVCYVVLGHIIDDDELSQVLQQIHQALKPSGQFIAIEQIRRQRTLCDNGYKVQRTRQEYCDLFTGSGFHVSDVQELRNGHFPSTYLLRQGWVPQKWFTPLAKLEKWYCQLNFGPLLDYRDTAFVLHAETS